MVTPSPIKAKGPIYTSFPIVAEDAIEAVESIPEVVLQLPHKHSLL